MSAWCPHPFDLQKNIAHFVASPRSNKILKTSLDMFFLLPWTHKNSNQKYFSSLTKINKSRNILNTSQFCVFYFSREFFWWKNERRSKKYLTNENWLLIFISRATHCVLIEIRRKMRKREMWILSFFFFLLCLQERSKLF